MGYFRRTIRRSRCAADVRAAQVAHPAPELWQYDLLPPGEPRQPQPERFFRLTSTNLHPRSHEPCGVFRAAGILECSRHLDPVDRDRLHGLFDWFHRSLPRPRNVKPSTIFWFRSQAGECASRVWEMVQLLRDNGIPIQTMWTRRPGWIEYQDRFQVGAVPFTDRPFRVRRL